MQKFETLTPTEAKEIEEKAVRNFTEKRTVNPTSDSDVILQVKSVFPLQLFPDELIVHKNKVTLINRTGPQMSQIRDMHLHDIAQVEADCGPFFGHLHVYPKLRTEEPLLIDRLSRDDTLKAREVIENMIEEDQRGRRSSY